MEQLLGLYTSPNSLQIPSGATIKAENVYLDTDGYFKPFKRIEKAMRDDFLGGQIVAGNETMSIFGESVNYSPPITFAGTKEIKLINLNGVMLILPLDINKQIIKHIYTGIDDNDIFDLGPNALEINQFTTPFVKFYGNFISLSRISDVFILNLYGFNGVKDYFYTPGALCYTAINKNFSLFSVNPSICYEIIPSLFPPYVYGATLDAIGLTDVLYDGDPSRASVNRPYASAYRFTTSSKINRFLLESKPTGSIYIREANNTNPGRYLKDILIRIREPSNNVLPGSEFKINIYRTPLQFGITGTNAAVPRESDDFRLISSVAITSNTITFSDVIIQPPGSSELYTNNTQDGILGQNEPIPLHKTSTIYRNYGFYANVKIKPFVVLDIAQTGAYVGAYSIELEKNKYYVQDYDVNLNSTSTYSLDRDISPYYSFSPPPFPPTPLIGIFNTINAGVNLPVRGFYATHLNSSGVGGKVTLETLDYNNDGIILRDYNSLSRKSGTYVQTGTTVLITISAHGFSVNDDIIVIDTSTGAINGQYKIENPITANDFTISGLISGSFTGNCRVTKISTTSSGIFTNLTGNLIESENTEFPNRLYYTKLQEPLSTTLTNYLDVYSDAPILYLANLREYILIFKTDGVFILRGKTEEDFTVDPLYPQITLLDPHAIQVIDDFAIGLFNIGVVKLNENGYEIISKEIRDDITKIINNFSDNIPYVFYHKARRLVFVGRETATYTPDDTSQVKGDLYPYVAHKSFVYHIDSKQWTSCNSINLNGAQEFQNEIYFPVELITDRLSQFSPRGLVPAQNYDFNFKWDIYRTAYGDNSQSYTDKFSIRFVKQFDRNVSQAHRRFLKIYFREMNFTSITIDYFPNYEINNSNKITVIYNNIPTFDNDNNNVSSRNVAYFMIPVEVARSNWLAFEIYSFVKSPGSIIELYNGILVEGFEVVENPSQSQTQ